jgi:carboxyl-terminal processing protease
VEAASDAGRRLAGLPEGAVIAEMLFGAFDSLDPYSRYLTPEMFHVYVDQFEGSYVGIGAELAIHDGRIFFKTVFAGGGAETAGLVPGDEVVVADGKPTAGMTLVEVGRLLRGKPGTSVTASVRTGGAGEAREVTLQRRRIHLPAVRDAVLLDAATGVAYVRLAEFQAGSAEAMKRALEQLVGQGAKSLILDLRDNPGGSLFEAVDVVGLFLADGPVIRTRGRMIGATWKYDVPPFDRPAWTGPLAVLTNGDTASASEIVASALQRRGRATIVGGRTYGKGAVQISFPLDWGSSAVYLTMARVYDVKDECTDGRGVTPDRAVPPPAAPPPSLALDPVVRAAEEALAAPRP